MGIGSNVARQIAGAAVSSFGFSLGRDIYKGTKKTKENGGFFIAIFAIVAFCLAGAFFSGLWFFRNYRDANTGFFARLGALTVFALTVVVGIVPLFFAASVADYPWIKSQFPVGFVLPHVFYELEYYARMPWEILLPGTEKSSITVPYGQPFDVQHVIAFKWGVTLLLVGLGALVGIGQRPARSAFWKTERKNQEFLSSVGLTDRPEGQMADADGNVYRIQSQSRDRIELFAIGRRNKRGYIGLDGNGCMTSWSGLVTAGKA